MLTFNISMQGYIFFLCTKINLLTFQRHETPRETKLQRSRTFRCRDLEEMKAVLNFAAGQARQRSEREKTKTSHRCEGLHHGPARVARERAPSKSCIGELYLFSFKAPPPASTSFSFKATPPLAPTSSGALHAAAACLCRDGAMRKAAVAVGGGGKGAAATTDLLVCFPARQRLALMPKPICSPSRATMDKAAARRRSQMPGARSSPMFRGSGKAKRTAGEEEEEDEPQSPKVTCAGQIKVGRPKKARAAAAMAKKQRDKGRDGGGKSWITVVEEIERMHGRRKKVGWLETVGIRRDALPFLGGVVRGLRHKARCLGSLHGAVDSSTEEEEEHGGERGGAAASVFSKWLMVLEGGDEPSEQDSRDEDEEHDEEDDDEQQSKSQDDECSSAPPPNALLLMRCRSAPAKGLSRRVTDEPPASEAQAEEGSGRGASEDADTEAEVRDDDLVFMSSAPGFLKLSIDIAKETWIVGGGDPLSRSRSWKR